MIKRHFLAVSMLLFLLSLLVAWPVMAQDTTQVTDDDVNEIAREVYCPVCENTPLDVCQTQACADWREVIREKLSEGQSEQDIFAYFANQYGDRVLATPPREGLNWLLWIWPLAAVIVGGIFFGRYLRQLKLAATNETQSVAKEANPSLPVASADKYVSQIEQELQKK